MDARQGSDRRRVRKGPGLRPVFLFQALSACTVLESTGQTEQLAPDFQTWLRSILEGEEPHVRRVSSVKISFPKH